MEKLTVFQKLGRVLGGEANTPTYTIDPEQFKNFEGDELKQKKLEAQQSFYLQNQWKKVDNELYQKAIYYEPSRVASYYDFEAMEFCLAGDTKIATPTGFVTIKELADRGKDFEFIVYSYDHNLQKVIPALARNAHHTRDEMTYKVIFDDDSYIIGTYDHRLMKRDGVFCKISELNVGDSMMPFYRKSFYNNQNYNWIYTCNKNEGHHGWVPEHTIVAETFQRPLNENEVVHHIDFNGKNNLPENLKIMDSKEHQAFHARHNNKKLWANPEYRAKMLEIGSRTDNKHHWNGERAGNKNPAYFHIPFDSIINAAKNQKTLFGTARKLNISHTKLQREISNAGYKDWSIFLEAYNIEKSKYSTATVKGDKYVLNHKIKKIEAHNIIPVYDLTVPGYKNFATDTIFSHNTPEISVALDIFADEACTPNEKGKILTIYSESSRIQSELTELFENTLDINTNATAWCRNICKYGENFVYNKIVPKKGIIGVTQLPNVEITRSEPGFTQITNYDDFQKERTSSFFWKDKSIEFNSFEVSHFRLLGDDRKLPYGTSILEKVRRIWKQLLLSEDAMLVYRVTRAPERRVYKIFVGNMDDKDVDPYVDKIANSFKRVNMVNSNNGNQDTRYNPLAVDQDYFIPVRDPALTMPIETLPGATNLSEIADIEYIQKKMLAALRVPKAFIGFEEVTGDGKNLAILDIRFARAVHRIQKALIQELNKMAIIHLYLKGYTDDLTNFTLSLTSPSTQADILKVQNWKEKITLYRDAVSDAGNGYSAMSMTYAKKEILNMSEDEIKLDVQRQAVEKAGAEEIKILSETIKQTGMFREIYKAYQINPNNMVSGNPDTNPDNQPEPEMGGGVGTDFTTPLTEPGAEGGETPASPPAELTGEPESLAETVKARMDNRRSKITESINRTIAEIDKMALK